MAFGFPAYFTETRYFSIQRHEFSQLVKEVLDILNWQFIDIELDEIHVNIGINAHSWGEKLKVKILPDGMILVESKCAFPFQCFDWGKNRRNVQIFFSKFKLAGKKVEFFEDHKGTGLAFDEKDFSRLEQIFNESEE